MKIKIGKYVVPLWLIAVSLVSGIGGALAYYVWHTLTMQFEVEEPLEILYCPAELSLYPGETEEFNVTIGNWASVNYSVVMDFQLSNETYQDSYVMFSNEIYTVIPGQQNLTAWVNIESSAPPVNASLTVHFRRGVYPDGLVGYWRFDEGSGTIAYDSSGNGYHGILVNDPVWVDGKYGKALSFDGIDDYVDCGTLGNFGSTVLGNVFTYTFWFKTSQTSFSAILGTENEPYPSTVLVIHLNTPEVDKIRIYLRDDNFKRLSGDLTEIFDFTETGWHHLALIVDTKSNDLALYIDGVSRPVTYRYKESPIAFSAFQYPLFIGAYNFMGSIEYEYPIYPLPMKTFEGIMDEVMIFSRALSPEDVEAIYTSGLP